MQYSPALVRKLFNYGIDFDKRFALRPHFQTDRFAYFKEGDLYVMGASIFTKKDPDLLDYIESENQRKTDSAQNRYVPFVDEGPPLKDGRLDIEKIEQYGLMIPEKSYLALGDNYAMSGDSREFGFVPQGNLRGVPSFIFWPPGSRFGAPNQPPFPWFTLPNVIIWTLGIAALLFWYIIHRRHHKLPLKDL